jgi:hypothetical protein
MKKAKKADELRPEYSRADFTSLVRGKYTLRLHDKSNVVVLEPEIAEIFPNGASVNAALRALAEIAKRTGSSPRRRS